MDIFMDVKQISLLHDNAMNLAEEAVILFQQGRNEEGKQKSKSAFLLESKAVIGLEELNLQPSLSIITASAAWLAKDAELITESITLATKVISYRIDGQLTKEMNDLLNELSELN